MASDEPSGARPGPVVLRIKLRYDDVEAMIERFAPNVGKTGLFLPTKSLQPLGAEIKFELRLSTGQPVLVGLGRVKAVRQPDPNNPKATFGMAIELMRVTRESRDLILRMLERRKVVGIPEIGIPLPADIDAARRSDFVDTGVKDYASGAIPQLISATDSSPTTSEPLMTAPRRQTGPIAVTKVAVVEPLPPEAPRRKRVPIAELIASASGPIATTNIDGFDDNVDVAAILARARALAGSDLDGDLEALRDAAAAPIAIDIEAASAELARQLGGAAVRRDRSARWAPPPPTARDADAKRDERDDSQPAPEVPASEIDAERELAAANDVDAKPDAANEVDAQGEPARDPIVAPEPAATEIDAQGEPARDDIVAPEPAATEIDAKHERAEIELHATHGYVRDDGEMRRELRGDLRDDAATPITSVEPEVPTHDDDDASLFERPSRRSFAPDNAAIKTEPSPGMIHDGADASQFEDHGDRAHEVEPEQIHDEIHRLEEGDFEEVEHTQIGQMHVDPEAFDQHAYATLPAEQAALAHSLDQQLDEAEREDLGFSERVDANDPAQSSGFSLEEPPTSGDYVIPLGRAERPPVHFAGQERHESLEAALAAAVNEEEQIEEIDDFEILAEADAEDADLLTATAEHEVSASQRAYPEPQRPASAHEPQYEAPPKRPSFLSRLELDDESGYHAPAAASQFDEFSHEPGELDPRLRSAGHALRAFEEPEDPGDFNAPGTFTPIPSDPFATPVGEQSYTFAGDISADEFDAPHGNYAAPNYPPQAPSYAGQSGAFVPPDAFDQSDVIAIPPATRQEAEDFPDLESALEALDVDLDDLGGSHGRRRGAPGRGRGDDVPTSRGGGVRQTGGGRVVTPASTPKSGRTHNRATTEDGIVIDFDDEDS